MQVALGDYSWAAGVATDLVNTAPGVWSGIDKLPDAAALEAFLRDHQVEPSAADSPAVAPADLASVRRLRDTTRALIDAPDPDHLVSGATELSTAVGALALATDGSGRRHWQAQTRPGSDLAEHLALVCAVGILGVVHTLGPERFRPCTAPTCSGAFIDTTRPGRRRYCMPDICGNRINVANHRARQAR
jgi:predicted RNA-binding Zn ribbon-like protein